MRLFDFLKRHVLICSVMLFRLQPGIAQDSTSAKNAVQYSAAVVGTLASYSNYITPFFSARYKAFEATARPLFATYKSQYDKRKQTVGGEIGLNWYPLQRRRPVVVYFHITYGVCHWAQQYEYYEYMAYHGFPNNTIHMVRIDSNHVVQKTRCVRAAALVVVRVNVRRFYMDLYYPGLELAWLRYRIKFSPEYWRSSIKYDYSEGKRAGIGIGYYFGDKEKFRHYDKMY